MAKMRPLTSVAVLVRHRSDLSQLTYVATTCSAYLDVTYNLTLAQTAAKCNSLRLLQHVAARQAEEWEHLSPLLIRCYRQEQFADTMNVLATRGFLTGARWLHEVYFPEGKVLYAATLAAMNGHADMLEWLLNTFPEDQTLDESALSGALSGGHVDVLRVMWRYNKLQTVPAQRLSAYIKGTHLSVLQFLHEHRPDFNSTSAMNDASSQGNLDVLLWFHDHRGEPFTDQIFTNVITHGHLNIAKYLYDHHSTVVSFSNKMMNEAAKQGHLEMLKWLHANRTEAFLPIAYNTFEVFATLTIEDTDKHWEVCKWLLNHQYSCPPRMFQVATASGNLPMLQWLYANYQDVFKVQAPSLLLELPSKGHLAIMQWFVEKGFKFQYGAMQMAAANDHLPAMKWLLEIQPDIPINGAMYSAAAVRGNVEIVRFLHEHRPEPIDIMTMNTAIARNHFEVVRFLHENCSAKCTKEAMDNAHDVKMLNFLHRNRTEGCTAHACAVAAITGRLLVMEWLYKHKRELVNLSLVRQMARAHRRYHIEYWVDAVKVGEI